MTVFAQRMKTMEKSASIIRGLFGAMNDPGIISFGGGAPAREALPVDIVREITNEVITRDGRGVEALQYGSVMGLPDLREIVVSELLAPKGVKLADIKEVVSHSHALAQCNAFFKQHPSWTLTPAANTARHPDPTDANPTPTG